MSFMKLLIEMYVKQLCVEDGIPMPEQDNTRFWPPTKDVYEAIRYTLSLLRDGAVDQVIVVVSYN